VATTARNEVEILAGGRFDCIDAIADNDHGMTELLDNAAGQFLVDGMVLGEQDAEFGGNVRARRRGRGQRRLSGQRLAACALENRRERKGTTGARITFDRDAASHEIDQSGTDGETQPGASLAAGGRSVHLGEDLEDEVLLVHGNAATGVGNREPEHGPYRHGAGIE